MTQKDYEKLAAALAITRDSAIASGVPSYRNDMLMQWRADAEIVADVLADDNPRFDRVRFLTACGESVVSGG